MSAQEDIVGAVHTKVRHDSARGHVTGSARYIDDMPALPGTLEVVLVTSPHAHARIVSIDVTRARQAAGVAGVVTATDIPGHNDVGPIFDGEPVLAKDIVDYVGAPVVAAAQPNPALTSGAPDDSSGSVATSPWLWLGVGADDMRFGFVRDAWCKGIVSIAMLCVNPSHLTGNHWK